MTNDSPISAEIELLSPAVGMNVLREDNINPFEHTPGENAVQTRRTKAERENVIVPERISKEVQGIERRPATQFSQTSEGPAVVMAFRVNVTSVGTFDSYGAIVEAPPLFIIWISVEKCNALVGEYLEFTW